MLASSAYPGYRGLSESFCKNTRWRKRLKEPSNISPCNIHGLSPILQSSGRPLSCIPADDLPLQATSKQRQNIESTRRTSSDQQDTPPQLSYLFEDHLVTLEFHKGNWKTELRSRPGWSVYIAGGATSRAWTKARKITYILNRVSSCRSLRPLAAARTTRRHFMLEMAPGTQAEMTFSCPI